MKRPSILVLDDERLIRWSIAAELEERGYEAREAESAAQAWVELERGVDVLVLDNDLPGLDAASLLAEVHQRRPDLPVIVLTGENGNTPEAVRRAASYLLEKPFEPRQVGAAVEGICRRPETDELDEERETARALDRLRGQSPAMAQLKQTLAQVVRGPARSILVIGEHGAGRHLAARVLHELSDRADRPLRLLAGPRPSRAALEAHLTDCAGGTLLVESLEALDHEVQDALIRFLESPSETRIVVLAGPDVSLALARGAIRGDLYEMLASTRVAVPPLRERQGDVAVLAHHFVTKLSGFLDTPVRSIDETAIAALEAHHWPGNVRELRDAIERAMLLGTQHTLTQDDFQRVGSNGNGDPAASYTLPPGGIDLKELERNLVIQALERTGGNRTRAAELLRMTRDQMRYRVAKFNLD